MPLGVASLLYVLWIAVSVQFVKCMRNQHAHINLKPNIPKPTYGRYAGKWHDHFDAYMNDVQKTKNPLGLSDQCTPYILEPTQGQTKGLQILIHGFTACPGQWYLLAPTLVHQGWTVMVPLMPGHGRKPLVEKNTSNRKGFKIEYWNEELPIQKTTYLNFTAEILNIALKHRAAHPDAQIALTGLSLGGTVVTKLLMDAPQLWDRVMLMNPFLSFPTGLLTDYGFSVTRTLIPKLLPIFGTFFFGRSCDLRWTENDGGTGAVCEGKMKNLQKVMEFANVVNSELMARSAQIGILHGGILERLANYIRALLTHEPGPLGYVLPKANITRCCCKKIKYQNEVRQCKLMHHDELRESRVPWKHHLVCPSERDYHRFDREEVGLAEVPKVCIQAAKTLQKRRLQVIQGIVPKVRVQVLATKSDPAVANSHIQFFANAMHLQLGEANQFGFCVWPEEFDHVYIAPMDYEAEERDAWWLDASRVAGEKTATELLFEFLNQGHFVPTHATERIKKGSLKGNKMCDMMTVPQE